MFCGFKTQIPPAYIILTSAVMSVLRKKKRKKKKERKKEVHIKIIILLKFIKGSTIQNIQARKWSFLTNMCIFLQQNDDQG